MVGAPRHSRLLDDFLILGKLNKTWEKNGKKHHLGLKSLESPIVEEVCFFYFFPSYLTV